MPKPEPTLFRDLYFKSLSNIVSTRLWTQNNPEQSSVSFACTIVHYRTLTKPLESSSGEIFVMQNTHFKLCYYLLFVVVLYHPD